MIITCRAGQIQEARQVNSPNCDLRPVGSAISLLVIHGISLPPGQFGSGDIDAFFCNTLEVAKDPFYAAIADLKVSAHALIERNGTITQYVNLDKRAWHAGQSSYLGQESCNDYAIGVELEGADDLPYTPEQYSSLAALAEILMQVYPGITSERIVGHSDIAPGRKTDPGPAFDWPYLRTLLVGVA